MKKKKIIEVLWTLMLLTTIFISSFYLLLLGSTSYRKIITETNEAELMRLPILYLSTAIKQADRAQISIEEKLGTEYIKVDYDQYFKMIYAHEGFLKELLVIKGAQFNLSDGELITELEELSFNIDEDQLNYEVNINGKTYAMQLAMR